MFLASHFFLNQAPNTGIRQGEIVELDQGSMELG